MAQEIIFTDNINNEIEKQIDANKFDKIFILTDENTSQLLCNTKNSKDIISNAHIITISSGDIHKNIESTMHVWKELSMHGATRFSCLINFGGGMITDLGGFAASTFKRGIKFINIPTTLLAMVDASVGGKTGINLNGLKNEIGVFNNAHAVITSPEILKTLDYNNFASGYAEMLKHSLISDKEEWVKHLNFNLSKPDYKILTELIKKSILTKERIVNEDPSERGIRKALNFGHTIGHALETFFLRKNAPILHGYAVAYGIICELYLSSQIMRFPIKELRQTVSFIQEYYGKKDITCNEYEELYTLMMHDKKNTIDGINFTLLSDIGKVNINKIVDKKHIFEALDFFREG